MYGKIMSLPDAAMSEWSRLLSAGEWDDLSASIDALGEGGDPMAAKHDLAHRIVSRIHDTESAERAATHFRRVVQRKEIPEDLPEIEIALEGREGVKLFELLVESSMAPSRSEARRLVQQGAVSLDRERCEDPTRLLESGRWLLQVGKRRYAHIRVTA